MKSLRTAGFCLLNDADFEYWVCGGKEEENEDLVPRAGQ